MSASRFRACRGAGSRGRRCGGGRLKVLFTTGYSRNAAIHNGVLDAGVQLIGKPFTVEELAIKLRAVLGRVESEAAASG